jgi:hypothetical protein
LENSSQRINKSPNNQNKGPNDRDGNLAEKPTLRRIKERIKDQNHRKHLKGEQAQTLAKLQELHPNKKRLKSQDIEATDEEYEAERSLDKRI